MQRTVKYRGFEIHIDLLSTSKEMFDVGFRIEGPVKLSSVAAPGGRLKMRGGPFSRRWAYLVRKSLARLPSISSLALRIRRES
jgi:hypothetical protein